MTELFSTYYSGIPVGMIIGFVSYMLGYGVGSFLLFVKIGAE